MAKSATGNGQQKRLFKRAKKNPIETTEELSQIISQAIKRSRKKLHPATLIFQALRIYVNRELDSIQEGVSQALQMLAPKGRIAVLSFHRLEDRIVKNIFRSASKKPMKQLEEGKETHYLPMLKLLSKKPLIPTREEFKSNRRARSAKLRIAEKI